MTTPYETVKGKGMACLYSPSTIARDTRNFSRLGGVKIGLILFVEYHNVFRESASAVMDREPDLEVVSQASSVAEAHCREGKSPQPGFRY